MDALKRILLSLALICLSPLNNFANEKESQKNFSNPIYDLFYKQVEKESPKTFEEILEIADKRYLEITARNNLLFKNTELESLAIKYNLQSANNLINSGLVYFTEDEEKIGKRYSKKLTKSLFDETRHSIIWADEVEEDLRDFIKGVFDSTLDGSKEDFPWLYGLADSIGALFRYGISFRGEKADGVPDYPSISEQRRIENRKRRERTGIELILPELGKRYLFDLSFEYEPEGMRFKDLCGGFETRGSIRDFKLFGNDINNMRVKFRTDQKAEASLTKILGEGWYATLFSEFQRLPNQPDSVGLAILREVPRYDIASCFERDHTSRFGLMIVYDEETRETIVSINYLYKWK